MSRGCRELEAGEAPLGRVRRPGGGRKQAGRPGSRAAAGAAGAGRAGRARGSDVAAAVDDQVDPHAGRRADPAGPPGLAPTRSADLLREEGFSLQANAKTLEGTQHPDRDAQFRYINEQVKDHQAAGEPVISVDTKKKELVGDYKNAGREWRPTGEPVRGRRPTTSPTGSWARPSRTGSTTWPRTPAGSTSAPTTTPPRSRSTRSAAGGTARGRHDYPQAAPAADHRRRGRLQRLPHPRLEGRTGRAGRRDRPGDHRLPLPARHLQVEQDRAPAVLPHHHELARPAADQPRGHRARPSPRPPPAPGCACTPNSTPAPTPPASRSATRQMAALPLTRHDLHGDWNYTLRPEPYPQIPAPRRIRSTSPAPTWPGCATPP